MSAVIICRFRLKFGLNAVELSSIKCSDGSALACLVRAVNNSLRGARLKRNMLASRACRVFNT